VIARSASRIAIVLAAALFTGACGVTATHRYASLSEQDQLAHFGTQTGYHRLSAYFAVSVSGGTLSKRVMEFYYYPRGGGRPVLIGTVTALLDRHADYGEQSQHFALSPDGTELLYFHEEALQYGPVHKTNGLYRFTHGRGDALVRDGGYREISQQDWSPATVAARPAR